MVRLPSLLTLREDTGLSFSVSSVKDDNDTVLGEGDTSMSLDMFLSKV